MFNIGFSELLLIAVAALVAIGPKDLPQILFRFGRLMRQGRLIFNRFRDEYAEIMHDIEVEHYRQKYGDDGKLLEEKKDGR